MTKTTNPLKIKEDLVQIATQILNIFTQTTIESTLYFQDYHGFSKSRLSRLMFENTLKQFGYHPDELQVEVVQVNSDLTEQVHYHKHSYAYICTLDQRHHFSPPDKAYVFKNSNWIPISLNDQWLIPPLTPHGFTVSKDGNLYFLSVQYPPIVHEDKDDYFVLTKPSISGKPHLAIDYHKKK